MFLDVFFSLLFWTIRSAYVSAFFPYQETVELNLFVQEDAKAKDVEVTKGPVARQDGHPTTGSIENF